MIFFVSACQSGFGSLQPKKHPGSPTKPPFFHFFLGGFGGNEVSPRSASKVWVYHQRFRVAHCWTLEKIYLSPRMLNRHHQDDVTFFPREFLPKFVTVTGWGGGRSNPFRTSHHRFGTKISWFLNLLSHFGP